MNEQVKLFLRNKGVELTTLLVNTIFVILCTIYGFMLLISLILFKDVLTEPNFVWQTWMSVPYTVAQVSILAAIGYGIFKAYENSNSLVGTIKQIGEVIFGIVIILSSLAFVVYLIVGFVAWATGMFGVMEPKDILPATVFELTVIGSAMYVIQVWLMSNWQDSKYGIKATFKPLWK